MNFIETHSVVKQFSGHLALDRVSINIPRGQIFGLLGPNGAGKTTLIRIINRITAPDSGKVLIEDREIQQSDVLRIGYMPEERGLYRKMKVGEQAIYLAQLKGLSYSTAKNRLKDWFKKFDIESWWNWKLEELSKGMQQKVQFIITAIHDPELLIFDEPFSGFDPVNADRLKQEILELKSAGKTIIFSTHNMASVEEICDEIALIDHSRVVLSGQVREIRRRYKTNIFTVQIPLNDNPILVSNDQFEIVEHRNLYDSIELRIRKPCELSNSELLTTLAREFEILSFMEEFPSMNEVFINTVSSKNQQ
jgi:ABC-2 type transport system ATP-binding protein